MILKTNFGNMISGILGVIVVFKAIKFLFNLIFNSYLLINVFGLTWRLIFAFWDSVFIIRRHNEENRADINANDQYGQIQMVEDEIAHGRNRDNIELLPLEFAEEERPSAPMVYRSASLVVPQYHRDAQA